MCKNDKVLGCFWVVWDKVVGPTAPFDSDKITRGDRYWRYEVDREAVWEEIKKENDFPNKDVDHYPHGEVMFDVKNHKFAVNGTPKLMNSQAFQNKIIRLYGLNSFTQFILE